MNQPSVNNLLLELKSSAIERSGGTLQLHVAWRWSLDRWQHRIVLHAASGSVVVMTSQEGESIGGWPGSPPWQQAYRQRVHGDPVVFGLGAACGVHWSAVAQGLRADDSDESKGLSFEVAASAADELHSGSAHLQSSYVLAPGAVVQTPKSTSGCSLKMTIGVDELYGVPLRVDTNDGRIRYCNTTRRLVISPRCAAGHTPTPVRWRYRVGLI